MPLFDKHHPMTRASVHPASPASRLVATALVALALGATALPAQAFWGLLGKAASGAGKAAGTAGKAAGTAGKAAGTAGAGAGAATLVDDAARAGGMGGKAALTEGAVGPGASALSGGANAVLPPEVAAYLSKPATALTGSDKAGMMDLYHRMVAQAGKTGDFTVVERLPVIHAAPHTLHVPPAPGTPAALLLEPSRPVAMESAGAHAASHALRLLAHAAHAGHRPAQDELVRRCAAPAMRTSADDMQALCRPPRT